MTNLTINQVTIKLKILQLSHLVWKRGRGTQLVRISCYSCFRGNLSVPITFFLNPHPRICFCRFFKEREKHQCERKNIIWLLPIRALTVDFTRNLCMYPDWERYPQPFRVQDDTSTN